MRAGPTSLWIGYFVIEPKHKSHISHMDPTGWIARRSVARSPVSPMPVMPIVDLATLRLPFAVNTMDSGANINSQRAWKVSGAKGPSTTRGRPKSVRNRLIAASMTITTFEGGIATRCRRLP